MVEVNSWTSRLTTCFGSFFDELVPIDAVSGINMELASDLEIFDI